MDERQGTDTRRQQEVNERLDQVGQILVDAVRLTDEEVDDVTSRVLGRRAWANLAAERARRAASSTWLDLILVGRRTVPALLTIAMVLAAWWWIGSTRLTRSVANVQDAQWERLALGGATMVSDDDVLTFVMRWPALEQTGQEGQR